MGNGEETIISLLEAIRDDIKDNNEEIAELGDKVAELDRTIRGSNGDKGLVTELAVLQSKVDTHISEPSHADAHAKVETSSSQDIADALDPKYVQWSWLRDKALMPIVIAFLVWFLLDILPTILANVTTLP